MIANLDRIAAHMRVGTDLRAWGVLALFLIFPILMVTSAAVLVTDMPLDIYVPLDGAWRVHEGHTPHLDFQTPIGLLYYETYGAAMALSGPSAKVLLTVPAVFSVGMLAVVAFATRGRLPDSLRVLFAAYLGFIVLSPMHLDEESMVHLASYNRLGWALVTALMLLVSLPPRERSPVAEALEVAAAVVALWVLFFVKITYFGLGGLVLIGVVLLVPQNRRLALVAGVLTWVGIGLAFALSEVPWAYVADIRAAIDSADPEWAQYNAERTPGVAKLVNDLMANLPLVVVSLVALPLAERWGGEDEDLGRTRLFAVGMLLVVLLGTLQSHDHHAPGLVAVIAVGLAYIVRRGEAGDVRLARLAAGLALAVALILGLRMARDAKAIAVHRLIAGNPEQTLAAAPSGPGADLRYLVEDGEETQPAMRFVVSGEVSPETFVALGLPLTGADLRLMLDRGRELIARHGPENPRVFTMLFSAPFPYLLENPPPKHTLSWYHPSRTFGGDHPLDPDVILSDVDLVLVPRALRTPQMRAMSIDLQPALDRDWRVVETAPLWVVYAR